VTNAARGLFGVCGGYSLERFTLGTSNGQFHLRDVHSWPLPDRPMSIWGTNDGVWLRYDDDQGTFGKYGFDRALVAQYNQNDIPGGLKTGGGLASHHYPQGIAADGAGIVYLTDHTRIVKLGPGGGHPPSGGGPNSPRLDCVR
jgi:hypothetical protein